MGKCFTNISKHFSRITNGIAAALLGALFCTFILQIFSRYAMQDPFGWTLELCLMLWIWLVFFCAAFMLQEKDHVRFDILFQMSSRRSQRSMSIISSTIIVISFAYALYPTIDYINWLKIRKSATLRIPMRTVFSIYGVFMLLIIIRYTYAAYRAVVCENELLEEQK
tara:strand:+ start:2926 stop:3426 length:501 start_codon:yes stop_codon:yes gene_type:complete